MVWYPHFPLHPFVAWQQRIGLRSLNCEVLNSAIVELAIFGICLRCSPVSSGISKAQAGFWEYITTYLILFSCKRTKSLVVVCWLGACDESFFGELKTNALNRRFLLLTSLRRDSFGVVLSFGMPVCIKAPRACTIGFYLWLLFSRIRSVFFGLPWPAESILLSSSEMICLCLDICSFHLLADSLSTKV